MLDTGVDVKCMGMTRTVARGTKMDNSEGHGKGFGMETQGGGVGG